MIVSDWDKHALDNRIDLEGLLLLKNSGVSNGNIILQKICALYLKDCDKIRTELNLNTRFWEVKMYIVCGNQRGEVMFDKRAC